MRVVQIQGADKRCPKLTEKMQRPAQKCDMAADRASAGKTGDGLIDNCLEDGGRKIFLGCALIDQRLDVRLREYAASGRDGVEGLIVFRVLIESCHIRLQQGGHLVDKGAGAAGTGSVHALVDAGSVKIDDLRILPAQLDRNICLGRMLLQTAGDRDNFLNETESSYCLQGSARRIR